jgi:hypothetical protein
MVLDLHRYWPDVTVARLEELDAIRQRNMSDLHRGRDSKNAATVGTR